MLVTTTLITLDHFANSDIVIIKPLDHFLGMSTTTFVIALDVLLSRVFLSLDFQQLLNVTRPALPCKHLLREPHIALL